MPDDSAIREYLLPAPDAFWEWRDDGEVTTWKDGTTIAFRDELRTILSWLAPRGLPPLSSIALLLAATHDNWNAGNGREWILAEMCHESVVNGILRNVMEGLERVRQLEPVLRTPARAKAVLCELVLGDSRIATEPEVAAAVVESMRAGLGELVTPPDVDVKTLGFGHLILVRDMSDMLPGLRQFDAETLRVRMATGMDALPDRADLELPPAELARALISSLKEDVEFAGLAQVANQLMSVASLPRRLDTREEYHSGGFSDISNRGSMERLLISELANDDLTLAVRVAMNEALYLRREIPPSTPQHHRAILVDAGIRSWGVPRVFATAVALAFMASTAKGGTYSCFRAQREMLQRADLATRDGLLEHLGRLEPDLNFAAAIPAFLRQLEDDADATEPILLMTEDALADPAVQESLRGVDLPQLFLATVNRDGVFRLAERGRYGLKPLREAKIDLEQLFREPPKLVQKWLPDEWPAIMSAEPFPLLLSHSVEWDRAFYVPNWGVLSATGDGRLLRWEKPDRGARQLSDEIAGKILWVSPTAVEGDVSLIVGGSSNARFLCVSQENVVFESVRLKPGSSGMNYCARDGVVFFISTRSVDVLSVQTGEVIQSLWLPKHVRWERDRFFFGLPHTWYALSHDGHTARLEEVECAGECRKLPPLVTMFDQAGVDGPIGVTVDGDLFSTATGNLRKVKHNLTGPLEVSWISSDGNRLRIKSLRPLGYQGILVNTEHLGFVAANHGYLEDRAQQVIRQTNLRHRFKAIGFDELGNLALESRKGNLLVFGVRKGLPVVSSRQRTTELRSRQAFDSIDHFDRRYQLWRATWPDGSRAVLDSRGLLHLTSSDGSIPAVTLVLAEGEMTGWVSNGRMWGNRYYTGDARNDASAAGQYTIYVSTVGRFVEQIHA